MWEGRDAGSFPLFQNAPLATCRLYQSGFPNLAFDAWDEGSQSSLVSAVGRPIDLPRGRFLRQSGRPYHPSCRNLHNPRRGFSSRPAALAHSEEATVFATRTCEQSCWCTLLMRPRATRTGSARKHLGQTIPGTRRLHAILLESE
jgi:hypothetical protein